MAYQTPNDGDYLKDKVQKEYRYQGVMDNWYRLKGYEIVTREGDKKRDLVINDGKANISVEEKYRESDYSDLLIELIQDVVSNYPGWFYVERPDRLAYIIIRDSRPHKLYWIKFEEFKSWLFDYLKGCSNPKVIISPRGFGITLNIAIPWAIIPSCIYQKFFIESIEVAGN